MQFVRVINGYDHLWAVKDPKKDYDELTALFERWNDADYLLRFFKANSTDLVGHFGISRMTEAIQDTFDDADELEELILGFPNTQNLDHLFRPLDATDARSVELTRRKARNWNRPKHASWLRVYAIRLEPNVYVVTGGAIKLTHLMQDRPHTQLELDKLNRCRSYLEANGVFDKDSFVDLDMED